MIKGILNTVLWIIAIFCIVYAVYRSTSIQEAFVQGNRELLYGTPQHGLILGLCIIAATCIMGSVLLILDKRDIRVTDREDLSKRTL